MAYHNDLFLSGKTIFSLLARLVEARNTLTLRTTWAPMTDELRPLILLTPGVVMTYSWKKVVPRILLRNYQKFCNQFISLSMLTRPWQHCSLP